MIFIYVLPHLHAVCVAMSPLSDIFCCVAFERFVSFVHKISLLYVENVLLNIVCFHRRSKFCVVAFVAKKPTRDVVGPCAILCDCTATSIAGRLEL
jgi:hypothetical protein